MSHFLRISLAERNCQFGREKRFGVCKPAWTGRFEQTGIFMPGYNNSISYSMRHDVAKRKSAFLHAARLCRRMARAAMCGTADCIVTRVTQAPTEDKDMTVPPVPRACGPCGAAAADILAHCWRAEVADMNAARGVRLLFPAGIGSLCSSLLRHYKFECFRLLIQAAKACLP
jgi:hypothetical protein